MKKLILLSGLMLFGVGCGTGGDDDQASLNCSLNGSNNIQVCGNSDSTITATQEIQNDTEKGFVVTKFLWKPNSESDGNLVVLVDIEGVSIVVTGAISETLLDGGPSNGFGTTGRGSFPGCDFGEGVIVEFFKNGQQLETASGASSILVENGCFRAEVTQ